MHNIARGRPAAGLVLMTACFFALSVNHSPADDASSDTATPSKTDATKKTKKREKIVKSDVEWRKQLSRKQFEITRRGGTERAFANRYWKHKAKGTYRCVCCDLPLFPSATKYKSGTGWPSFFAPIDDDNIAKKVDRKLFFEVRTEVLCSRCDAHLGHVFGDGPRPTGLRYCLNSAALKFEPAKKKSTKKKSDDDPLEGEPTKDKTASGAEAEGSAAKEK